MKTIQNYQLIIASIIIAASFLLYGHGQRFQLMQVSEGRFFQVNKYTGQITQVCQLEPAHCYKWKGIMLENKDDYFDELLNQKRQEKGLPNKED